MKKIKVSGVEYDEDYLEHCINYGSGGSCSGNPPSSYEVRKQKEWEDSITDEHLDKMCEWIEEFTNKTGLFTAPGEKLMWLRAQRRVNSVLKKCGDVSSLNFLNLAAHHATSDENTND